MIKRVILITIFASTIFLLSSSFAQKASLPTEQSTSTQQGEPKTIFSFKDELGLSDEQENKIKAILFDSQNLIKSYRNTLNILGAELAQMIDRKEEMELIKNKLQEISEIKVEISYCDIEVARKINDLLTPTQLQKWEDIKRASSQPAK